MTQLVKYEAARHALANAVKFDEVMEIKDTAERMALYARQAKDTDLINKANEIKLRAERRAGQMLIEAADSGERAIGRPNKVSLETTLIPATLEEIGITRDQSSKWQKLAAIPETEFEASIAKHATVKEILREQKKEENAALPKLETPEGVYDVIVIDPPWPMQKIDRDVRPNQVAFDYPVMSLEDICDMQLPSADDCHIFCWTTQKFLPAAITALCSWDFHYILTMVWHKPGGFQPIGLPQYNCEFVLYGRKGTPKFIDTKAFPCCFNAPRGEHSEKPQSFYDTIVRVTDGKRLDMFSRQERNGFTGWGNQHGKL
jgi:N6-adenosine-specific RNA methylase IME4